MSNNAHNNILNDFNLTSIMNTVLDGLIVIDSHGCIQAFNPAACAIFGYSSDEILGKNIKILMPEPYQAEHNGYINDYLSSKKAKIIGIGREVKGMRKSGEIFPMELSVNNMKNGEATMFVGMVRDISERKQTEETIQVFIEKLKQSNHDLNEFAYIASHDLKEPLRGLNNNAFFLKEDFGDKLSPEAIMRVDRIIYLSERMEQLVNDLLHYSRLSKQDLAYQECTIPSIVDDVTSMIDSLLHETHTTVTISDEMPVIMGDRVRMREVFHNLIINGIKYNTNKYKKIDIGYAGNDTFFVKDNGIGIPKQYYSEIFRIFKRLNTEDDATKGTGVGLTFVKKVIERHNGEIWVESEVGKGSTFYFTIPGGRVDAPIGIQNNANR